jgi:predicted nucleic acid-binding Zn ribbon protein
MAEYTFRCRKCEKVVVIEHAMTAPHPTHHEGCGGTLGRIYDSQALVVYKSTGFTRTDNRFKVDHNDV